MDPRIQGRSWVLTPEIISWMDTLEITVFVTFLDHLFGVPKRVKTWRVKNMFLQSQKWSKPCHSRLRFLHLIPFLHHVFNMFQPPKWSKIGSKTGDFGGVQNRPLGVPLLGPLFDPLFQTIWGWCAYVLMVTCSSPLSLLRGLGITRSVITMGLW